MSEPTLSLSEAQTAITYSPAPRVTEDSIKSRIAKIEYRLIGETGTVCVITMINGWNTIGYSAPASAANFNPEVGQRYAYENAFRNLWQLEGYLLRENLYRALPDEPEIALLYAERTLETLRLAEKLKIAHSLIEAMTRAMEEPLDPE